MGRQRKAERQMPGGGGGREGTFFREVKEMEGVTKPVAKFIVLDRGDTVDFGTGLSYQPARLHRLAGRYDNNIPQSETMNFRY